MHAAKERLSFISYSDLLSSTPTSTLPFRSLATSALTSELPPHIPNVNRLGDCLWGYWAAGADELEIEYKARGDSSWEEGEYCVG